MSDLDDEIRKRRQAFNMLDSYDESWRDSRRLLKSDDGISTQDELDQIDQIIGADGDGDSGSIAAPGASLAQKVSIRNSKHNALIEQAPFMRINPVSVLKGILGNQAQIQSGSTNEVCNWGGDDAETTPVTVTLAPVNGIAGVTSGPVALRPYGIIRFGTKGFAAYAEVDIGTGVQFTISASYVTVQVALDGTSTGLNLPNGDKMYLTGMLSFLPITHTQNLTRTKYIDVVLGVPSSPNIAVPPFARSVQLWGTNVATIAFVDSTGTTRYTFAYTPNQMTTPVPLSPDITTVSLSTGGPTLTAGNLIFNLAF